MKAKEFRERLLAEMYIVARNGNGFSVPVDPRPVADQLGFDRPNGLLRSSIDELERAGFVSLTREYGLGDDGGLSSFITARGIDAAEELLESKPQLEGVAPASDRYVSIADNYVGETKEHIAALRTAVEQANDVDPEARLIAMSEIAVFEATIVQPRVAVDLIERFVNAVVAWLLKTFTAVAVTKAAEALILLLKAKILSGAP